MVVVMLQGMEDESGQKERKGKRRKNRDDGDEGTGRKVK